MDSSNRPSFDTKDEEIEYWKSLAEQIMQEYVLTRIKKKSYFIFIS